MGHAGSILVDAQHSGGACRYGARVLRLTLARKGYWALRLARNLFFCRAFRIAFLTATLTSVAAVGATFFYWAIDKEGSMRYLLLTFFLGGCAGMQQQQLTGLENIAAGLLCAQSGVCLTVGAPGQCVAPPLPDALLVPCPPPDPKKDARENAAIQMQCSIVSSTLLAVVEYSKAVCPPAAVPAATRASAPAAKSVIYLNR